MARVCERPTCSQPADVTYGIDPYELVVTLEAFDAVRSRRAGVLCRDHADSMVVPNGWTLDDRREIAPRLFQSRESAKVKPRRRIRRRRLTDDDTGQLRLSVNFTDIDDDDAGAEVIELNKPRPRPTGLAPWQPVFDQTDDLDGLLTARSPLLSRAFGKDKQSRSEDAVGNNDTQNESARPTDQEGRRGGRRSKGPKAV
ncbi:MAG: hypothetical protein ABL953_06175 [Ilumatobacteraceae bacterium]